MDGGGGGQPHSLASWGRGAFLPTCLLSGEGPSWLMRGLEGGVIAHTRAVACDSQGRGMNMEGGALLTCMQEHVIHRAGG